MKYVTKETLIKNATDKLVLLDNQEEALNTIATLINIHLRKLRAMERGTPMDMLPMNSALLIARTGCGKSHIIKSLADVAGLNVVTLDASAISPEGYKGTTLSQLFFNAKNNCSESKDFDTSIVIIDEFCKLRFRPNEGSNAQFNLLQAVEGKGVACDLTQGKCETIATDKMLFIFSGAFDGLEEQINLRKNYTKKIGFIGDDSEKEDDILKLATMDDIRNYGFNRELLGRIGTLLYIPPITKKGYKKLLQAEKGSFQEKYNKLYHFSGVEFKIDDSACNIIADKSVELNFGARAISTILQGALSESFSEIDQNQKISTVILTTENNELTLKYKEGRRKKDELFPEIIEEKVTIDADDTNFAHRILTTENIHFMCNELMGLCNVNSIEDGLTLFYYLQTTIRFLADYRPVNEHCTSSLIKLAKVTDKEKRDSVTIYDRVMQSTLKNLKEDENIEFQSYYKMFAKHVTPETEKMLTRCTEIIYNNYYETQKNKPQPLGWGFSLFIIGLSWYYLFLW